jgi:hypothetical protein
MRERPEDVEIEQDHPGLASTVRALAGIFALQDVILLAYLAVTGLMIWQTPPGPFLAGCARVNYASMAALSVGCFVSRGLVGLPVRLREGLYRLSLVGVSVSIGIALRDLLRLLRPEARDEVLVGLDVRLFGIQPTRWMEHASPQPIVEWFSLSCLGYLGLCTAYVIAMVWWLRRGRKTSEFAIGTLIVVVIGQLGYLAAPAYGPARYMWSWSSRTVQFGWVMNDPFSALQFAVPLWLTLHARRQARTAPGWRWPARIIGVSSANIVLATTLLRGHIGVEAVAGIALAVGSAAVAPRLAMLEASWRRSMGFAHPWCFEVRDGEPARGRDPI